MRSSEEMALVLYHAWARHNRHSDAAQEEWDDIGEYDQTLYLAEVDALMRYLFEHGRISAYISYDMLERLKEEYRLYLLAKSEVKE